MKFIFHFLSLFTILAMLEKLNASSMILNWKPSVSPNVTGYVVYYGTTGGNSLYKMNVGNTTTVTIPNLTAGATYHFAAAAYTSSGFESVLSAAITVAVPQAVSSPPPPATNPGRGGTTVSNQRGTITSNRGGVTLRSGSTTARSAVNTARSLVDEANGSPESNPASTAAEEMAAPLTTEPAPTQMINLTMTQAADAPAVASMQFSVEPGHWYEVQATTDFQNWISIWQSELAISNGWSQFTDPDSKSYNSRFYRLISH